MRLGSSCTVCAHTLRHVCRVGYLQQVGAVGFVHASATDSCMRLQKVQCQPCNVSAWCVAAVPAADRGVERHPPGGVAAGAWPTTPEPNSICWHSLQ
jgi:hypothetical protein